MGDPMMFGTLKEFGFGLMVEVFSFEYMLSRISTPIATALREHRGLSAAAVEWFAHHSEVDIEHAEEAFVTLDDYIAHYDMDLDDAQTIADMVSRENLFIKRYFGTLESWPQAVGLSKNEATLTQGLWTRYPLRGSLRAQHQRAQGQRCHRGAN